MDSLQSKPKNFWFNSKRLKSLVAACLIAFLLLIICPIANFDLLKDSAGPENVEESFRVDEPHPSLLEINRTNFGSLGSSPTTTNNKRSENKTEIGETHEMDTNIYVVQLNPEPTSTTGERPQENPLNESARDYINHSQGSSQSKGIDKDKLLGGLVAPGFNEGTCLSRNQSVQYRKPSPYRPSPYLISKLRNYEDTHKRCGPHTKPFNETMEQLKSFGTTTNLSITDCKYVIWLHSGGLGNKMVSMASTFVYALLTNRVFLIEQIPEDANLFCEPFPDSTWLLPSEFPIRIATQRDYGILKRRNKINSSSFNWPPPSLHINLLHGNSYHDKLFFCDENQAPLYNVPWLFIRSNLYFLPPLFTIQSFEQELERMFPSKVTVFHQLGRYLFHPSNEVWGIITRFYKAYLAKADEIVGIQIRVFERGRHPLPHVMDQILSCTAKENILPTTLDIKNKATSNSSHQNYLKSVLVVSLYSEYYKNLRKMFLNKPTVSGEIVRFHQPSHERVQKIGDKMHNIKAWSEIYLLSMSDVLVTSAQSTFGYVAYSLGGLRPWFLTRPLNRTTPHPPCLRAISMEPCLHAPPRKDTTVTQHNVCGVVGKCLGPCEDRGYGIKLFDV